MRSYKNLFKDFSITLPTAVVLGMSANGLSAIRSLGRKGIRVIGIDHDVNEPGMYSHYCTPMHCPDPLLSEDAFIQYLADIGKRLPRKGVLFMTGDDFIESVSRNRTSLYTYFEFILPEPWIVESFLDKRKTYAAAKKYAIPHPETYYLASFDDYKNIQHSVHYPCCLKPVYSHIWKKTYGGKKLLVVNSPDEMTLELENLRREGQQIMVQELIPGKDSDIYCLSAYYDREHRVKAFFVTRKLRQYPIHFGIGCFNKSEYNKNVVESGLDFLTRMKYTGMAGVEFKYDRRDNQLKFMEINIRTIISNELAVASGVDFPYIYYCDAVNIKLEDITTFKEGIKLVNFELDNASFWKYRKLNEITLIEWLRSFRGKIIHTYFAWDDLMPSIVVYKRFILMLLSRIAGFLFKKSGTNNIKKLKNSPTAVVLDMTANGLSVVRSLGRKGIPVIGIDDTREQPAMYSRYCSPMKCPNVLRYENDFLDFLIGVGEKLSQKGILFSTGDKYIAAVSKHRDRLSSYYHFALPGKDVVEAFLDKRKSYQVAQKLGIPCPATYMIVTAEDLKKLPEDLRFPCSLKPVYSHIWKIRYGGKKLVIVNSLKELIKTYAELAREGMQVMIQELIPGKDSDIFCFMAYYDKNHHPKAVFTKKKLRQYPIRYGIGCFNVSEKNAELVALSLKLLSGISYTGLAGIEFKYDHRDKQFKFMEINLRTLMSSELAIASGVDFPYIYYRDLAGAEVADVTEFKEGTKLVNLELDIASFWNYRNQGELTLKEWLKSFSGRVHHTYFARDDLRPFLFVCRRFFLILARHFFSRGKNRGKSSGSVSSSAGTANILHLTSTSGYYGKEHCITALAHEQMRMSHSKITVGVIANRYDSHEALVKKLNDEHIPFIVFPGKNRFDLKTIVSLKSYISDNRIGIIHSHDYKSNFVSLFATVGTDVTRIATVHNWIETDIKLFCYTFIDKLFLRFFHGIATTSEEIRQKLLAWRINDKKLSFIPNGIDSNRFHKQFDGLALKKSLSIGCDEIIVGTIGRLSPEKGHQYLLESMAAALKQCPTLKLIIVGTGPEEESLKQFARELHIVKQVVFAGQRDDIPELLGIMDIFVLPSIIEGLPVAALEAMASGTPVIATTVGSLTSLIQHNITGLLVNPKQPRELADAIIALAKDTRTADSLAENAQKKVLKEFSSAGMAVQYMNLYKIFF